MVRMSVSNHLATDSSTRARWGATPFSMIAPRWSRVSLGKKVLDSWTRFCPKIPPARLQRALRLSQEQFFFFSGRRGGHGKVVVRQGDYDGVTTPVENGRRFLTPLWAGCLLTGWEAAFSRAERCRTPLDLLELSASHPVSRQSAQTSGVRKRLPFSLCIRPAVAVTSALFSHLVVR